MSSEYFCKSAQGALIFLLGLVLILSPFHITYVAGHSSETTVGELAPEFSIFEIFSNEIITLDDFHEKVVILDLFTTWCAPCKETIPYLNAISHSYSPDDLAIISINIDASESQQLIRSYALENQMTWIVAMDTENVIKLRYCTISGEIEIPSIYIINQTGYVCYQEVGFDNNQIIEVLDNLLTPDSLSPEFNSVQINPKSTPISIKNNKIEVKCQSVTDNLGVESVYAEVHSIKKELTKTYDLSFLDNGTIDSVFDIDPIQLYMESSISIQIVAKDYRGNIAKSNKEVYDILLSSNDNRPPIITNTTFSVSTKNNYHYYEINVTITDDILVYKVEIILNEINNLKQYTARYKFDEQNIDSNHIIWVDCSDQNIFRAIFVVKEQEITNTKNLYFTVTAEDLIGGKTTIISHDLDELNNTNLITPWNGTSLILSMVFLVLFLKKIRIW